MSNKLPRRNFLARAGLALSAAIAAPFVSSIKAADEESQKDDKPMNPIKKNTTPWI